MGTRCGWGPAIVGYDATRRLNADTGVAQRACESQGGGDAVQAAELMNPIAAASLGVSVRSKNAGQGRRNAALSSRCSRQAAYYLRPSPDNDRGAGSDSRPRDSVAQYVAKASVDKKP